MAFFTSVGIIVCVLAVVGGSIALTGVILAFVDKVKQNEKRIKNLERKLDRGRE